MQIGGFVKQSLIDYPGKIAAIVFTQGCNFRCGYCHNPGLVLPELFHQNQAISVNEVLCYLQERKNWLDGVVVTGGEPTIHKDLPEFLKKIKNLGYLVKLDTNGSNPYMLEHVLKEKLVDYIAMDVKTILKVTAYSQITGISEQNSITESIIASIKLIKQSDVDYEFRTTNIPDVHTPEILKLLASYFTGAERYVVNQYRAGDTIEL